MEIRIDGKETEVNVEGISTFGDLMNHIENEIVDFPRVVTRVVLNEEELDEGQEIGFGGFSIDGVMSLELHTLDRVELAYESLEDAQIYLPELATVLEHAAGTIREGNISDGIQVASEALEFIGGFGQVLDGIRTSFRIDFAGVRIDDFTLLDKLIELNSHAGKVLEAMRLEDWTLFADLIEYEISPLLYQWMAVIPELMRLLPQSTVVEDCSGNESGGELPG